MHKITFNGMPDRIILSFITVMSGTLLSILYQKIYTYLEIIHTVNCICGSTKLTNCNVLVKTHQLHKICKKIIILFDAILERIISMHCIKLMLGHFWSQ